MGAPAFQEIDPERDCGCPGCVQARRSAAARPLSARFGGGAAARGIAVVAAAASAALGATPAAAVPTRAPHVPRLPHVPHLPHLPADLPRAADGDLPPTPQGAPTPLRGLTPASRAPATTRTQIINRAKVWVAAQVPYSVSGYWSDGYRQDCSGFVSMAWSLGSNEWTGSLASFGVKITKEELQPGDMLLFHNTADPNNGSHVVIFGGWTDYTHTAYTAYEQTPPHTRRGATPYPYWNHTGQYVPYRYKGVTSDTAGAPPATGTKEPVPYPGARYFGPGADNASVLKLGRLLVARGAGAYYPKGPAREWSDADRQATRAFQRAQGWTGSAADGLPGPRTWELLVTGKGANIPAAPGTSGTSGSSGTNGVPGYPGRGYFRPGQSNAYVTRLGERLVEQGFGRFYAQGPGPRWGEADRRAVEAFQRGQGWRGGAADGYPGPETWRRLFA
ncbi:peptidoglycan-binding protein [Streptomyces sp. J2-1]|uniref:peptidoglycan-binding protein n=1 Tax=Streptomyces corallincola TaxID=2851888 RepID=UPI001C386EDA|nr:peptidoglycan-binding protein [Streptomyces corallincola]MBV2357551.1 peptidoglycan-binding protein [Streptomyces corallincola]